MTTDLLAEIKSAAEGSERLDAELFWIAFPEYERGKTPLVSCQPFSRSLDAKLPGENIVMVQKSLDGQFLAHHETPNGIIWPAVANTEPLARRAAALRAILEKESDRPHPRSRSPVRAGRQP